MKLVTYKQGAETRSGLLVGDRLDTIIDLKRGLACLDRKLDGYSVLALVEHGTQGLDAARDVLAAWESTNLPEMHEGGPTLVSLSAVTLLSPIPRPPSMRDGYAFRQHVATARKNRGLDMIPEFDQFPVFYFTNHQAVVGPGPVKVKERHLERLDFELEAAIVVGREGRDLSAKEADAYVFGMTIMNDFSARALQMQEMTLSLGPAKGKDFATGLGPYLVTMDELAPRAKKTDAGDHYDLGMRAFVNGKQVSTGNVKDMTWTFAQILERASYGVTLYPGDVIGSGTCGTGCFLELNGSKITDNQWLQVGDVVALEIDRLGRLENTITS
ncbi:MAG: fumarylacetoacetate hydrolase family protein [Labilithrix sp.]|nr:fumarylacetoacetate hydrolase family protein [Labilithrix sp.]MCW5816557.1 fumarylacetoacetate hydrolase family protein [Labilithrix sp.]